MRAVSEILCASVSAEEIVYRYGGDEFLLIRPGLGTDPSFQRAEEIRKRVSMTRLDFQGEGGKDTTVSIGVSTYPQAGQAVDELIRAADQALYDAIEGGRTQVTIAESTTAVGNTPIFTPSACGRSSELSPFRASPVAPPVRSLLIKAFPCAS